MWLPGSEGFWRMRSYYLMGRVSAWEDEKFWRLGGGDGLTTVSTLNANELFS